MGSKLRKTGIVIGVIIAIIVVFGAIGAANMPSGTTGAISKYDGLTEEQISRVKVVKEACDTRAMMYSYGSDELTKKLEDRCKQAEANLIEEYRTKNTS